MLLLSTSDLPPSPDQLRSALLDPLRSLFILPSAHPIIEIVGHRYPALDLLRIDLTGAQVIPDRQPPIPAGLSPAAASISADRLELAAHPLSYEQAALDLSLTADSVRFDLARDSRNRAWLTLADAGRGTVDARISLADLQALLLAAARLAAAGHGITVKSAELTLTPLGDRSIAAEARITAAKLFVTTTIRILGRLDIDDTLHAHLSNLACHGVGKIGDLVCALIRPHVEKYNNRSISLLALPLGDIRLRDLHLATTDPLHLTAHFGH